MNPEELELIYAQAERDNTFLYENIDVRKAYGQYFAQTNILKRTHEVERKTLYNELRRSIAKAYVEHKRREREV